MEKSYGIEAARAQLGDIADHARSTGQVINLTRHGRPVAVIGPVSAIKPLAGVQVRLYLGDQDAVSYTFPDVPRIGESILVETPDGDEDFWDVVNVQWDIRPNEAPAVNVLANEPAKES
ncbi:type II toxin-antitoxin system Phd/YefM family antitoxin [Streptomyces anulatus]|uniref:type II toxin-antitoxin system Phd/YefM family antitoxin n=1 Tax=Streptomyces anulatus TaxID=1892 RepID=UPI001C5E5C60|nr:type II toxin-antitoxin system Phd/YefM family antitoxin [Streptomyces anulatus]QYA98733.1 type II toxin-antitoxin system Phd/YefM family antitoxin [Streptomyces anulatus]